MTNRQLLSEFRPTPSINQLTRISFLFAYERPHQQKNFAVPLSCSLREFLQAFKLNEIAKKTVIYKIDNEIFRNFIKEKTAFKKLYFSDAKKQ